MDRFSGTQKRSRSRKASSTWVVVGDATLEVEQRGYDIHSELFNDIRVIDLHKRYIVLIALIIDVLQFCEDVFTFLVSFVVYGSGWEKIRILKMSRKKATLQSVRDGLLRVVSYFSGHSMLTADHVSRSAASLRKSNAFHE